MDWIEVATAAATLFLIMDPLGNVPVFHAVLSSIDKEKRNRIVARELLIALVILMGFLWAGNVILAFFGLTQSSLNIAGGILLFIISLRMIFPGRSLADEALEVDEPFIVPLAVPMIAGPSTIAVLLLLSSGEPGWMLQWSLALMLAWLASAVFLFASPLILDLVGERGARAMERLMGMVLVILATQMLLNGIRDFVHSL